MDRDLADPRGDFTDFYRAEYQNVVRFLLYSGVQPDAAEDAAQGAFASMLGNWESIDQPKAYIKVTALRIAFRFHRKNAREQLMTDELVRQAIDLAAVSDETAAVDERITVARALTHLPPGQAAVLALTLEDHTPQEIGDKLGVEPATVRSNLRHARARLREFMLRDEWAINAGHPDPLTARTPAELAAVLRQYRDWAGQPSFREISDRSGRQFAAATLASALRNNKLPRLSVVEAVITGCGGSKADQERFAAAWQKIKADMPARPPSGKAVTTSQAVLRESSAHSSPLPSSRQTSRSQAVGSHAATAAA